MKKKVIIPIVILFTLVSTNPSLKDYQDFLGSQKTVTKRSTNFFIYSIYTASTIITEDTNGEAHNEGIEGEHIGILGNFFNRKKTPPMWFVLLFFFGILFIIIEIFEFIISKFK